MSLTDLINNAGVFLAKLEGKDINEGTVANADGTLSDVWSSGAPTGSTDVYVPGSEAKAEFVAPIVMKNLVLGGLSSHSVTADHAFTANDVNLGGHDLLDLKGASTIVGVLTGGQTTVESSLTAAYVKGARLAVEAGATASVSHADFTQFVLGAAPAATLTGSTSTAAAAAKAAAVAAPVSKLPVFTFLANHVGSNVLDVENTAGATINLSAETFTSAILENAVTAKDGSIRGIVHLENAAGKTVDAFQFQASSQSAVFGTTFNGHQLATLVSAKLS